MTKKSNLDLVIADFLQYIPKPARDDYELILRRCNFNDPTDPLFPILLFLLFLQDNLSGGAEKLAEEIRLLRTGLKDGSSRPQSSKLSAWWKYAGILLLALQLALSIFCAGKIAAIKTTPGVVRSTDDVPAFYANEIQRLNLYWDAKLQNIDKEKKQMNYSEILNENVVRFFIGGAMLFMLITVLQLILMVFTLRKMVCCNEQILKMGARSEHDYQKLCAMKGYPDPLDPKNWPMPDEMVIPPPTDAFPETPAANANRWGLEPSPVTAAADAGKTPVDGEKK